MSRLPREAFTLARMLARVGTVSRMREPLRRPLGRLWTPLRAYLARLIGRWE